METLHLPVLVLGQGHDGPLLLQQAEKVAVFVVRSIANVDFLGLTQIDVLFNVGPHLPTQALQVSIDHADPFQVVEKAYIGMARLLGKTTNFGRKSVRKIQVRQSVADKKPVKRELTCWIFFQLTQAFFFLVKNDV
mgnify:CR=1 FL=1